MGRPALVHTRSVRGGLAVPWRRTGAIAGIVGAIIALLYVGARETPVFSVRTIEISGAPADVRDEVRATAEAVEGESLVALDGGALVHDLEALPSVRSASYDRAFPNTLRIFVRPERPVALVELGDERWIVSERGRVISSAPDSADRLPRFRLAAREGLGPGSFLADQPTRVILGALAVVPKRFPAQIRSVRLEAGTLTFVLDASWGTPQLRLGEPVDVAVKLAAAGLVLRKIPAAERSSVGYVDASLPERVVVGPNPQVQG